MLTRNILVECDPFFQKKKRHNGTNLLTIRVELPVALRLIVHTTGLEELTLGAAFPSCFFGFDECGHNKF